jgi:hypothetical protein
MPAPRMTKDGKVIHESMPGVTYIGRDNQCDYDNCRDYQISGSRHCWQHARR